MDENDDLLSLSFVLSFFNYFCLLNSAVFPHILSSSLVSLSLFPTHVRSFSFFPIFVNVLYASPLLSLLPLILSVLPKIVT